MKAVLESPTNCKSAILKHLQQAAEFVATFPDDVDILDASVNEFSVRLLIGPEDFRQRFAGRTARQFHDHLFIGENFTRVACIDHSLTWVEVEQEYLVP